ncbi:MAG: cofactor-independent phosphoglycerate mutase [Candidatus Diapherotrites archaeon]
MKFILVVSDGMCDWPLEQLNGKTVLEAAKKKNMDFLAQHGVCGEMNNLFEGLPFCSSVANLSLLGYDPKKYFSGRGPIEAVAAGVEFSADDTVFRCNLVTEKNGVLEDYSAGHLSSEEGKELVAALNEKLGGNGVEFFPGVSYRQILILSGKNFCGKVQCEQPHDWCGTEIEKILPKANGNGASAATQKKLLELIKASKGVLENHPVNEKRKKEGKNPANLIWPWSGGKKLAIPSFKEKFGLSGAVISAVDLIFGIGISAGLEPVKVKGATGLWDTNYEGKADAAVEALKEKDFVLVHIEAPDEAGHAGRIDLKKKAIEDIDEKAIGRIVEKLNAQKIPFCIAVMADHLTPIKAKTHVLGKVPFLVYSSEWSPEKSVECFDEKTVAAKGIGVIEGKDFMEFFISIGSKQ